MSEENQIPEPGQVSPWDPTVPDLSIPNQPGRVSPWDPTVAHPPGPSWPPAQGYAQRRETASRGTTILLIVLALALIGGGLGFILYATTVQYRSTLHAQSTAEARLTAQAQATVQAKDQATANAFATANGKIYGSATAQAAVTATLTGQVNDATATAMALGDLYTQATSGTAALDDPLSDNSGHHGWDETRGRVNGQCVFSKGAYHAAEALQHFLQPCMAQASNFSDFAYMVQMTIDKSGVQSEQDGIIFRANTVIGSFYLFRVGVDGKFALDRYNNNRLAATLTQGYSAAITTGLKQSNEIAVIAYKGTLYLYINKTFITSVVDNSLSSGKVGVAAIDYQYPTEAEFSNAQVWNVTATTFTTTPTPSTTASPSATSTASPTATSTSSPTATSSPSATPSSTP